jgi:hypothetical protein
VKYPSRFDLATPGRINRGHVAVGILPSNPAGTVRCAAFKLLPDNSAPAVLALGAFNAAVAVPGESRVFRFDPAWAYESNNGAGSFNAQFPFYDEHALLIKFYDDADPSVNADWSKLVFGGGEDEIDFIGGTDKRDLTEIYNAIMGSGALAAALLGFEYIDTNNQATDTLIFHPFLLINGQVVQGPFLHTASVGVYEVDGTAPLFTVTDTPPYASTLSSAVNAVVTVFNLPSTVGLVAGQILAVDDELVQIVSVDNATQITVTRGVQSTTPAAHSMGAEIWRSGADGRGIFSASKVDTSALIYNRSYTARVTIRWKTIEYVSTHQFLFRENDI